MSNSAMQNFCFICIGIIVADDASFFNCKILVRIFVVVKTGRVYLLVSSSSPLI